MDLLTECSKLCRMNKPNFITVASERERTRLITEKEINHIAEIGINDITGKV